MSPLDVWGRFWNGLSRRSRFARRYPETAARLVGVALGLLLLTVAWAFGWRPR